MEKGQSKRFQEHLQMLGNYGKANPKVMGAMNRLNEASSKNGVLPSKIKELIGLGIAISAQCEGCMSMHIQGAMSQGATREEVVETIGVAITMGGGPAAFHGALAYKILEEYEASQK